MCTYTDTRPVRHHANHAAESHSTPFGQRQVLNAPSSFSSILSHTHTSPTNSGNCGMTLTCDIKVAARKPSAVKRSHQCGGARSGLVPPRSFSYSTVRGSAPPPITSQHLPRSITKEGKTRGERRGPMIGMDRYCGSRS
jgi:hypothetical protein